MPLTALSRAVNLEKSLNSYVQSTLQNADGIQIDYPGDKTIFTPAGGLWVKVDYLLGTSRQFMGTIRAEGERGNYVSGIINLNCCELVARRTDRYALAGLRDKVRFRFREGSSIALRDYDTAGNPVVGYWCTEEITENVVADGFGENDLGIATWNVSAEGYYFEVI